MPCTSLNLIRVIYMTNFVMEHTQSIEVGGVPAKQPVLRVIAMNADGSPISGGGGGGSTDPVKLAPLTQGTNRSGTVTAGGTAQQLAAVNNNRKSLVIQNLSDAVLIVNEHGAASETAGFELAPKAGISILSRNAVSVFGSTTGQRWSATETSV